jgi:nucleoside-diphosphate-sugar epimerase
MTVAVSGANGFTGRFVCAELQRRKIPFFALLRPGSDVSWMAAREIPVRFADLTDSHQLSEQLRDCRALLNVASIGFGAAPSILQACHSAGVRRAVFVSTTAIFTQLNAGSKTVRQAAEAAILASGLQTTILRPTMIYGTPGDRNMIRLVQWINRWPVLPVFGNGRSLQQPVHVTDVAWAVVQALDSPATINRQFNLSGAEPLTYNEVVRVTAQVLGRRICRLHIPAQPVVSLLDVTERLGVTLPIKAEQIRRLNEDKAFSHAEAQETFGYAPIAFQEGIRQEVVLFRAGRDGLSA